MASERGISTVVDVALALLFVSAAVLVLAVHLDDGGNAVDPEVADRTAETVAGTTITAEYSFADSAAVAGEDHPGESLTRVVHGPAAGVLADAALANVSFGNDPLADYGTDFEAAVDAALTQQLSGANERAQVISVWRPYEGSSIEGVATAGRTPPADADVSSVSMTVPSDVDSIHEEAALAYADLEAWNASASYAAGDRVHEAGVAYEATTDTAARPSSSADWTELGAYDPGVDGLEGVSHAVAEAIVDGYLPPAAANHSLEIGRDHPDRSLTVDRYERLASIVDVSDEDAFEDALNRTSADAATANDLLAEDLAAWLVDEGDLEALEPALDDVDEDDHEALEAAFADALSTDDVTIVVRTWDP